MPIVDSRTKYWIIGILLCSSPSKRSSDYARRNQETTCHSTGNIELSSACLSLLFKLLTLIDKVDSLAYLYYSSIGKAGFQSTCSYLDSSNQNNPLQFNQALPFSHAHSSLTIYLVVPV